MVVFKEFRFKNILFFLFLAMIGALAIGYIEGRGYLEYIFLTIDSLSDRSWQGDGARISTFKDATVLISNDPLGVGASNYYLVGSQTINQAIEPNPHNSYLLILVENGFLGLLVKLWFIGYLVYFLHKRNHVILSIMLFCLCLLNMANCYHQIMGFDLLILAGILNVRKNR